MQQSLDKSDRLRLLALGLLACALFSCLVLQFYTIQIVQHKRWQQRAYDQHTFVVREPFQRGVFYGAAQRGGDGEERPLAVDIEKFHLYLDPKSIPERHEQELADALVELTGVEAAAATKLREQFTYRQSRSRKLVMWLDQKTKDAIKEWWLPFARAHKLPTNAVYFVSDYKRSYPYGSMLGQVLHTIQDIKDADTGQGVPTGGLEAYFDPLLKGREGKRRMLRSPRNAFATGTVIEEPQHGASIYLTIDPVLQAIMEDELQRAVREAGAKGGWAVLLNPFNGEVMALAQYPFFHPEIYREYFNDPDRVSSTRLKVATDAYEPGSIMKPVTLAIALQANKDAGKLILDPLEKIPTLDGHFPGRSKPLVDTRPHRYLDMYMGLQRSSNIYMARIIDRVVESLGNEWYRAQLTGTFGFGQPTGIETPIETSGLVPTPGKLHPNGALEWSRPTPYSLAMGYNLQASGLQLVRAYATFANGGYLINPTMVKKVVKANGEESAHLPEMSDMTRFPRVLEPDVVSEVIKAMKYVTKSTGSGRHANLPGYSEVGKSGTARKLVNGQYTDQRHVSSFIGIAPASAPRFVLLVSIDEPQPIYVPGLGDNRLGGVAAGPAFRRIATRSLEYLGVERDDPYGYAKLDPRFDPERADWIPETKALTERYRQWNDGA